MIVAIFECVHGNLKCTVFCFIIPLSVMSQPQSSSDVRSSGPVQTSVHAHPSSFVCHRYAAQVRTVIMVPNRFLHLGQIFWFQVDTMKELTDINGRVSRLAYDILGFLENFEDTTKLHRQSVPRYSKFAGFTSYISRRRYRLRSHTRVVPTIAADILRDLQAGNNVLFIASSLAVCNRVVTAVNVAPSFRTFDSGLHHVDWVLSSCGPVPAI